MGSKISKGGPGSAVFPSVTGSELDCFNLSCLPPQQPLLSVSCLSLLLWVHSEFDQSLCVGSIGDVSSRARSPPLCRGGTLPQVTEFRLFVKRALTLCHVASVLGQVDVFVGWLIRTKP